MALKWMKCDCIWSREVRGVPCHGGVACNFKSHGSVCDCNWDVNVPLEARFLMNGMFCDAILTDFVWRFHSTRLVYCSVLWCKTKRRLVIRCAKDEVLGLQSRRDEMLLQGGLGDDGRWSSSRLKRNLVRPAEKTGGPSFESSQL